MNPEIQSAIDNLVSALRTNSPPTATAFDLFANHSEVEVRFHSRTPEGLKIDGISMRNLKGEFIK